MEHTHMDTFDGLSSPTMGGYVRGQRWASRAGPTVLRHTVRAHSFVSMVAMHKKVEAGGASCIHQGLCVDMRYGPSKVKLVRFYIVVYPIPI